MTPPLTGTILPGITRDSVITLAKAAGHKVKERPVSFDEWRTDAASGKIARGVRLRHRRRDHPDRHGPVRRWRVHHAHGGTGAVTTSLRQSLVDIQRGPGRGPRTAGSAASSKC